jgi:hypothetical protein
MISMSMKAPLTPAPQAILSPAPAPTRRLLLLFFIAILLPTSRGSVKRRNGQKNELKPSEQLNNSSEKARKEKL